MIDMLLNLLKSGFEGIMKMVYMLFDFIGKAFGLLFWFLDGIFYFVGQLFLVLIKVVMLFVALFQFLGAIVVGFLKTIGNMLVMHASTPNLPSKNWRWLECRCPSAIKDWIYGCCSSCTYWTYLVLFLLKN